MSQAELQGKGKNVVSCDSVSKHITLKSATETSRHNNRSFGIFDKVNFCI